MSSNQKKVANVKRRTWDTETYEKRAKDRQQQQNDDGNSKVHKTKTPSNADDGTTTKTTFHDTTTTNDEIIIQEEFQPAPAGAVGPEGSERAYLQARKNRVDGIDTKIGSSEIISVDAAAIISKKKIAEITTKTDTTTTTTTKSNNNNKKKVAKENPITNVVQKVGIGWHCSVCDCFLKDSHTYLDHINGRKHQRALGYSMRVERSSKEQVLEKLTELISIKSNNTSNNKNDSDPINIHDLVQQKDDEEQLRKEERQRKRKERKLKIKNNKDGMNDNHDDNDNDEGKDNNSDEKNPQQTEKTDPNNDPTNDNNNNDDHENDDEEVVEEEIDPALAAMMGFSNFGGSRR